MSSSTTVPCWEAAVSRLRPSVVNLVSWELGKCRWELDSREQLQANTLCSQNVRGISVVTDTMCKLQSVLLMQWAWMSLHTIPLTSSAFFFNTLAKSQSCLHPLYVFPLSRLGQFIDLKVFVMEIGSCDLHHVGTNHSHLTAKVLHITADIPLAH